MATEIEVTAEDIAKGVRGICSACPLALAIQRVTGAKVVAVGGGDVYIGWSPVFSRTAKLPPAAADFVDAFDEGRPVEPFTFTLG